MTDSDVPTPHALVEEKGLVVALNNALSMLIPHDRRILEMVLGDGLTYAEFGVRYPGRKGGKSRAVVGQRLAIARERFKAALEREGYGVEEVREALRGERRT